MQFSLISSLHHLALDSNFSIQISRVGYVQYVMRVPKVKLSSKSECLYLFLWPTISVELLDGFWCISASFCSLLLSYQ